MLFGMLKANGTFHFCPLKTLEEEYFSLILLNTRLYFKFGFKILISIVELEFMVILLNIEGHNLAKYIRKEIPLVIILI
jgi:hypothetical protein